MAVFEVDGVVTDDALKYYSQFFGGLAGTPSSVTVPGTPPTSWDPRLKFFRVGEGGWQDVGMGKVPRVPDTSLRNLVPPLVQDIDSIVDLSRPLAFQRYAPDARTFFTKNLVLADLVFEPPSTLLVRCLLDFSDYNDDGFGNNPEIWEIGLFSDHPEVAGAGLLVAYGTFPVEIKDNTKQIVNNVRIVWGV
jgi:hypothetical protein